MTAFSKAEASEKGIKATVELKSLNGRYLDINFKCPRTMSQKEILVRDIVKTSISRGSVTVAVNIEYENPSQLFSINEDIALAVFQSLKDLKKKMNLRETVKLDNVLAFSQFFNNGKENEDSELEWKITNKALSKALAQLDKMRNQEGQEIFKDFNNRLRKVASSVAKIEELSAQRVINEREKLRQKIALLFESDEIDENRIQMEIVMIANRLDISEECVRLRSHLKFFRETTKSNDPIGQKLNFLLQEMNREINTIGSKADSAEISQIVVQVKEELERIREQVQNVE